MRRLQARKGMALALLPALLLAAGGCAKTPAAPVSREAAALTWTIVDEAGGVGRGDFTGKAVTAVLSALDTPPVITYLTGDQSLLVSRMLALDELPDLLTVPAGGALRSKIIGSGRVWNIRELSETLADSLPEDIRCAYQNNSGELFSLPGGYTAQGYRPVATEGLYVRQEYASLLGNPAMDTPEKFARALEAFVRLATENRLIGSDELLPVVFGEENRGLATVEHICGVLPLYRDELEYKLAQKLEPGYEKPEPPEVPEHTVDLNLIAGANGEIYETSDMYPAFIKVAQEEQNNEAVQVFTRAKLAEAYHAERYLDAYNTIDTPTDDKYYLCPICGYIHKGENFTACPICLAPKASFKEY